MSESGDLTSWLVAWDDLGLDTVINLTELECQYVMAVLRDGHAKDQRSMVVRSLVMRASLDEDRHPEVWEFQARPGVSTLYIRHQFAHDPEAIKSAIRSNGLKLV